MGSSQANIVEVPKEILEETYQYADSKKYMSWEKFYTWYLADITRNTIYQYGKARLAEAYKTEGSVQKIAAILPGSVAP